MPGAPDVYDQSMEGPLLGRRRMLELGAGLLGAATLDACAPAESRPEAGTATHAAQQPDAMTGTPSADPAQAPAGLRRLRGRVRSWNSGPDPLSRTSGPASPRNGRWPRRCCPGRAGQHKLPVAVFLHGTGSSNRFIFDVLGAQAVLQRHLAEGGLPFAIAAVDGADTWWHPRADGTDTQSMLLAEFIPLLAGPGVRHRQPRPSGPVDGWIRRAFVGLAGKDPGAPGRRRHEPGRLERVRRRPGGCLRQQRRLRGQ